MELKGVEVEMKVYQVVKSYFDGDHDHGEYKSPLFSNRKAAEQFQEKISTEAEDGKRWWSEEGLITNYDSFVIELDILDECPDQIEDAEVYLSLTWT